jgi:uncharacterized membrane protein (DUF4010 family)
MELLPTFEKLAIALGLGLLVGLQRERVQTRLAGIRTFTLITLAGAIAGLLAQEFSSWIIAAGFVALGMVLAVGYLANFAEAPKDLGLTTEIAALVMFGVGAYVTVGSSAVSIAVGGTVALLLHWKGALHTFVARIDDEELKGTMQFVLVALVILPVLPNQAYGPFEVLNPHNVWLMAVLIVGISLAGYVSYRQLGERAGAMIAGFLGGMISSTATTVSAARSARGNPASVPMAALIIILASTSMYVRMLLEVAVTAAGSFWPLALPLLVLLLGMALVALVMIWLMRRQTAAELPPHGNPAQLLPALIFAAAYAVVLLASAAAKEYLGEAGLYSVAVLSGLHDVDAITLSTARSVEQEEISAGLGGRLMVIATLANFVTKAVIAAALGSPRLLYWLAAPFGIALLLGAISMMFVD